MKKIQGDLIKLTLEGRFDVIVHGNHCFCEMGKGLAASIREAFPEAEDANRATPKGDLAKLGTCSFATCERNGHLFYVVNAYTQFHWDGDGASDLINYDALRSCMRWVKQRYAGKRIGLAKIGSVLARGNWERIRIIMEEEFTGEDATIVEYVR